MKGTRLCLFCRSVHWEPVPRLARYLPPIINKSKSIKTKNIFERNREDYLCRCMKRQYILTGNGSRSLERLLFCHMPHSTKHEYR